MASLTVRNLDDALKSRLRVRAASRGRSMEEEARNILRAALAESPPRGAGLGERIRQRFAALGDVELALATRESVREPPVAATLSASKAKAPARSRRRSSL